MFNAHQYILKDIMEAEDFAAARRIQNEQNRTLDQHQRPVFINANAGLAYITVPRHEGPPRTVSFQCLLHRFGRYSKILIEDPFRHFLMKKPTDP